MGKDLKIYLSINKFWSHSASVAVFSKAINLDSIVSLTIHVFLVYYQETVVPPSINAYPLVDLISSLSDIQFTSLYPSKTSA